MTSGQIPRDAVRVERVFDAPISLVWQMWTESEHFAAWYGPAGATIPVARMDVRPGGTRLVCMEVTTPKGPVQMWFAGEYREVVATKRLVYTEWISNENGDQLSPSEVGLPPDHPATTEVHVELDEIDGRTTMILTHVGIPASSPGALGWTMALDKLAEHLASRS